jgi:ribosomal RNA assembly protein
MTEEFAYTLKIPKDRVGVLIGPAGSMKDDIEKATKTKLNVDSKEGEVIITSTDGLKLYEAREVVHAIARGFNPKIAMRLLKADNVLEIIDITDYTGKSKNTQLRLKGRVIGSEGKSKREIERLTGAEMQVYGKTVAIIGEVDAATDARRAIEQLLAGAPHAGVYRFLEKRRRERKFSPL